jgi:hypothetical protein
MGWWVGKKQTRHELAHTADDGSTTMSSEPVPFGVFGGKV